MKMTLFREPSTTEATPGRLLVDGQFECFTLEDVMREVAGQPVSAWKIPGRTAIPAGTYRVVVSLSQRFHRELPLLENVPGFEGIRIHGGNDAGDTEGCLLVGKVRNSPNRISNCAPALEAIIAKLRQAAERGEEANMEVRNP